MIAFDLASLSFGTSLLQRLQQFAPELSPRVRKCCLLGVHFIQVTTICCGGSLSSVQPEVRFRANLSYVHTQLLSFAQRVPTTRFLASAKRNLLQPGSGAAN